MLERGTKVAIAAGGRGSRMGERTAHTQKCVLEIDGKPILAHILDELGTAFGSLNVIVGINYKADQVIETISRHKNKSTQVKYEFHEDGSETARVYETMKQHFKPKETILGVPGDVIVTPRTYMDTHKAQIKRAPAITVTASPWVDEVDTHSLLQEQLGQVTEFLYQPSKDVYLDAYYRDIGIYAFEVELLNYFKKLKPDLHGAMMSSFIAHLAAQGDVGTSVAYDKWLHVGYPEDLRKSWKQRRGVSFVKGL